MFNAEVCPAMQDCFELNCSHLSLPEVAAAAVPENSSRRRDHTKMYCRRSSEPLQMRNIKSVLRLIALASLQNVAAQSLFNTSDAPSPAGNSTAPILWGSTMATSSFSQPTPQPFESTIPPSRTSRPTISSVPTRAPVPIPTENPTSMMLLPSAQPSYNDTLTIMRPCSQLLLISQNEEFDEIEKGIYCLQIQSYTDQFGLYLGLPEIVTQCEIFNQGLASGRKKRWGFLERVWPFTRQSTTTDTTTGTLLNIEFTIVYSTSYGYEEIYIYPSLFQDYVNANLEQITIDMQTRFLPVIEAKEVIVYNTDAPTVSPVPTKAPTESAPSTLSPIGEGETLPPSSMKSLSPAVTLAPSISQSPVLPVVDTPKPTRAEIVPDQRSFVVGLAAGLSGAVLVVLLFILYTKRTMNQRKRDGGHELEESRKSQLGAEMSYTDNGNGKVVINDLLEDGNGLGTGEINEPIDMIVSNPSMVSEGGSLGSNPNDIQEGVPVETLQDEFDNYKNQDLEFMRHGVEESVYGSEGMMSLAMTRALMEEEDDTVDWGGAQDCASMEANIFCDVNDWLRKNENASMERRIAFFQEILNKMVITVRRGMVRPGDGTRVIHCCAAMMGIPLETDLPNNVLLVYGMRKTSDINQGRSHLIDAFKQFGDIETAGINPKNKGFGFVRFSHPKSVDRAFDRFKVSEIEVQDVSVMMKPLKPEGQTTL